MMGDYMKKDKTDRRKKLMVYFIAFIMIASTFGVVFWGYNDDTSKKKYNGYTFTRTENGWLTVIDKKSFTFYHAPDELESIKLNQTVRDALSGKTQIGLTSDEGDYLNRTIALMQYIYTETLRDASNKYTATGFTANNTYGKQVFSCAQASENQPVIYFKKAKEPSITSEGNCVTITAETDYEMVVMSERLLYYMTGIMKE